jgi:hypothetical protein
MIKGRLKRSLKDRCPICGKVLQIRIIESESVLEGEIVTKKKEYICCSNKSCDYESVDKTRR